MKNLSYCLLSGLLIVTCPGKSDAKGASWQKTTNGITVHVNNSDIQKPRLVRLEVMGDKLIRVSATPASVFADLKSLIIIPQKNKTPFTVVEKGDTITLSTNKLKASVLTSTGEVWFTDKKGKVFLAENKGGGKLFTPKEADGTKGYTVRQVFESPADEAFYGLGQHQADEFNYKGKNEELFQYNTKVSIPFIVSNKNYGILLDSYSLCRFGNPNDYSQLNRLFTLYDKEGKQGSLTGTYTPKEGNTLVRQEDSIYFENLKTIKNLPQNFPLSTSKVIYEGEIEPHQSGEFKFILYYAGYIKVYINNQLVVPERWRTAWNPNSYKFSASLQSGVRVPVRIEWQPDGQESYCGLRALAPVNADEQGKQSWWSEMSKQLDYYFIAGDNMDDVISGYRTLTGKSQVMPKWAMGFWQSRERYKTQEELVGTLKEFRKRHIPVDNIVQDWSYWPEDQWGSHDFDTPRYPDPQAMLDSVHALHGRFMISVWPKFYTNTEHFKEFDKNGWMYRQAVKDGLRDWIGKGYTYSFYDAYAPGARKLFWQQMNDKLYSKFKYGVDAWWMDASEPNVRDCTDIDYRKALCGPTALGSSTEFFNAYALMNAEAIYDGQRSVNPNQRVFLLTRSGFAGLQRYSTATWSGDIATRWEDMKAQISAGLNFSISGIPYWTMDIGGFCVENRYVKGQNVWDKTGTENEDNKEWRELNARWHQFGTFAPLFRTHGQYPFREVWNIAPESHPAYQSILYYMKLRYRLMPYIYSMAGMTWLKDYTIMRPLVMDFTADANVNSIGDQYMFGPALMVCPVYTYKARSRKVYFPKAEGWYDFYSGKFLQGGVERSVDAPYERMPLYVRAGSILPVGPDMEYTEQKKADPVTLYVYAGKDGTFTLYEDEGTNYNYEKGAYATIPFSYNNATGTLTIGNRKGQFKGMATQRTFKVVLVSPSSPTGYGQENNAKTIRYNGKKLTINLK